MLIDEMNTKQLFEKKGENKIKLLLDRLIEIRSFYLNELASSNSSNPISFKQKIKFNMINNFHFDVPEKTINSIISDKTDNINYLRTFGNTFNIQIKKERARSHNFFISQNLINNNNHHKLTKEHHIENTGADLHNNIIMKLKKKNINEIISNLNVDKLKYNKMYQNLEKSFVYNNYHSPVKAKNTVSNIEYNQTFQYFSKTTHIDHKNLSLDQNTVKNHLIRENYHINFNQDIKNKKKSILF